MNKLLSVLLVCLFLASCGREKPKYAVIYGQVPLSQNRKMQLIDKNVVREIPITHNGKFRDTIENYGNKNYFMLSYNKTNLPLFIEDGAVIQIDAKNGLEKAEIGGEYGQIIQYLRQKGEILGENIYYKKREFYSLEPQQMLQRLNQAFSKVENSLQSSMIENFVSIEKKALKYEKQYILSTYPSYYKFLNDKEPDLPESFPKTQKIDLENTIDYQKYQSYRKMAMAQVIDPCQQKGNKEAFEDVFKVAKSIKNEPLRDDLIRYLLEISAGQKKDVIERLNDFAQGCVKDQGLREEITKWWEKSQRLLPGNPSHGFAFENYKKGKTTLSDLKGKLVYIDLWATWCPDCIREIPSLKETQKRYQDKEITFVSISIDEKNRENIWRDMIEKKQLQGVQLFSANSPDRDKFFDFFCVAYIPHFILLDRDGKIIMANAPKPSQGQTLWQLIDENL